MRAHRLVAATLLTCGFVIAACGDDDDDGGSRAASAPALADLAGRTFTSTSVDGHTLVEGSSVALTFDAEGVSVIAGCNTMRGGATIDDGELSIEEPMASTMMACSEELMGQDQWLQSFLTSDPSITLDGDELTLVEDGVTLVASG